MDNPSDEPNKSLLIFGHDVSKIPCFRSSFLYGISGGVAAGLVTFMATSRPALSSHTGMGFFTVTTLCYWFHCRYQFSKYKFEYSKIQTAMRQQAIYEGTGLEEEVRKKAEDA